MSRVFTARLDIEGNASTIDPNVFEIYARVIDFSLAGYSVADAQVGDIIYDENIMTGDHNRWVIDSVVAIGSGAYMGAVASSIKALVSWDDVGAVDANGPAASSGAICRSSPKGLSESPNLSFHGISEALSIRLRNIDNRKVIDPQLGVGGGGGGETVKQMQNGHTGTIAAGKPVSKLSTGRIVPADSDAANGQKFIGFTKLSVALDALVDVYLPGNNIAGAVTGLGFTPGDEVFLGENTGEVTNDPDSLTGANDSIIRLGIADCAAGAASGTATDLVMFPEVIARP